MCVNNKGNNKGKHRGRTTEKTRKKRSCGVTRETCVYVVQVRHHANTDSYKQEDIFAEEIIEETIHQINLTKSLSLKVSFVLLSDQQILHKQFLNAIQTIQNGEDSFGIFYCPTSSKIL